MKCVGETGADPENIKKIRSGDFSANDEKTQVSIGYFDNSKKVAADRDRLNLLFSSFSVSPNASLKRPGSWMLMENYKKTLSSLNSQLTSQKKKYKLCTICAKTKREPATAKLHTKCTNVTDRLLNFKEVLILPLIYLNKIVSV